MALEKLKIAIEKKFPTFEPPVEVLFNPNQLTISRTGWSTSKGTMAPQDRPSSLSVKLFFDTTLIQFKSPKDRDVRYFTRRIYNLTRPKGDLGRPPMCRLLWGRGDMVLLQGILVSVTKTLTYFLDDGTPVRATLDCKFEEWEPADQKAKARNRIDDPIRVVRRGETLSSIAAEEYNDPAQWRLIADANGLDNPRQLHPGQVINVPPLPAGAGGRSSG
jgi:hypothetical protein